MAQYETDSDSEEEEEEEDEYQPWLKEDHPGLTEAEELIGMIENEIRWVDIKPYSHNIINFCLPRLSKFKTEDEMEQFIIESGLRDIGW